ncbi:MAG: DUF2336 domain-containing protein [Rhizobiales bacterium]|nr:DUF2336 domain-containing protein [Hyphomicrobiales bacterium]
MTELDTALSRVSDSQHNSILRRITDLFLNDSERFSDEHVAVFDDVIYRLIERTEHSALIELSAKLAPVDNAPVNVVVRLSNEDDIAISGPVLEQSEVLTEQNLAEIAKKKGQEHLAAIAGRQRIGESVTDILVDRGNSEVACKVTGNQGARFSEPGFVKLIKRAKNDKTLAAAVAVVDVPANVIVCLAYDDDIAIAGPILEKSNVLTAEILADIAMTKSHRHLAAIAERAQINESVTDALIARGKSDVTRKIAGNEGAHFSEIGFVKLINSAKSDKVLAATIAARSDIPPELMPFLQLALA